ncbi:MAG: adaptin N terminal region-domain-containing protein [Piptocephalis tieghemiana]|nr:MAG: adaptin N terminal region-domain-containing protein [Piptocephalis tieghemiana]
MNWQKKDEDSGEAIFANLDKTIVAQETRVFNESPIKPRACRILLAKLCGVLYTGETFGRKEATDLFFSITKLFQSPDPSLRQMVYLSIKELSTITDDVIMVTSSLMKDMQPKSELSYRANAIRALCCITDPSMLQSVERFLKAAVVDRVHQISSAALTGSYHFHTAPGAREIVRRWSNEVQEAVAAKSASGFSSFISGSGSSASQANQGSSYIVQYHALGLLYGIRQHDRMAVTKMVQGFGARSSSSSMSSSSSPLKSPLAVALLLRYAYKVLGEDSGQHRELYEFLEGYLRHRSDIVSYEAAKLICSMPSASARELYPAVNVLQLLLSSPKATLRFAAIRTLNGLAQRVPAAVQTCNLEMEGLISDGNRSVATLAITTLLKTGNEASVDRLMKQISGFMSEISDEFKVIVVSAVRSLCLKFPSKQGVMLTFLSGILREEGGYEYKRSIIDAIFDVSSSIPEAMPSALVQLCEFIEDCEYPKLAARILHFLGAEGPSLPNPTVYIRHIYNRVVLENAVVRAAAVTALAKFGVECEDPEVKKSVRVLLSRCLEDRDDEVRDRAAMYVRIMEDQDAAETYIKDDTTLSIVALERSLMDYCQNLGTPGAADTPFSSSLIPRVPRAQEMMEARHQGASPLAEPLSGPGALESSSTPGVSTPLASTPVKEGPSREERAAEYAKTLGAIDAFASYGPLFSSSPKPLPLTESETEYVVTYVKHTFASHVIFQFNCTNTINDQLLEAVTVQMIPGVEPDEATGLIPETEVECPSLPYNQPGVTYVSYRRASPDVFPMDTWACSLKFTVKDCDPSTGEPDEEGYEDEYQLEDAEWTIGDYIQASYLGDFDKTWASLGEDYELIETFSLTALNGLTEACDTLVDILGMLPVGETGRPGSHSGTMHTLLLEGLFLGGTKALVRSRMTYAPGSGVTMEFSVRSESDEVSQLLVEAIM